MKPNVRYPRHLIVVFLIFAISIGVLGHLSYENQKRHIKKAIENELSAIADLKVDEIAKWRIERLGDANVISQSPIIASKVQEWFENPQDMGHKEEIYKWMRSLRKNYYYQSVIIVDVAGNIRLSVPDDDIGSTARRLIEEAVRDKKVILSDIYSSLLPGNPIRISLVAPLFAAKGGDSVPIGAVLLRIDPHQFLYPHIQSWPTPSKTSETVLARLEDNNVVYLNELRHIKNTGLSFLLPVSRIDLPEVMAVQGQRGIVEAVDYRGIPVVAALRAVPDTNWFLIAKVDTDEIFGPIRERAGNMAVLVGMLIISSGLIIGLFWRRKEGEQLQKAHDELEIMVGERTRELEQARQQNELILNTAGEGIYMLDAGGKTIFVNPAALEMLGYSAEEIKRKSAHQLFHHSKVDGTPYPVEECPVHQTLLDGAVHYGSGEVFWRKDGTSFPIDFASTPIKKGELFGAVIVFKDITDRVRAEEEKSRLNEELKLRIAELEAANKELGAFSYNVSHDLRAPLRAIAGFSSILLDEYSDKLDDEGKRLLGVVRNNARKMGQLVDGLTEYLRMGRIHISRVQLNMKILVEDVLEEFKPLYTGRSVQLDIKDLPPGLGDKGMLRHVWANLISNAYKFSRPREVAVIEIGGWTAENPPLPSLTKGDILTPLLEKLEKLESRTGFNIYYVKDNGVGFDMRYESKLFNVFQHLHGLEEFEGAGIGLAIVKRIIEKHGGLVWAEGKVNGGATFYFALPKE